MVSDENSVAVIMTCYNEGAYIGDAVRSVLHQSRPDLISEIVIADDGSGEETTNILRDVETWDTRINVIFGPGGNGLSLQRCLAIERTSAPYIAILDGDDIWSVEKISKQLDYLEKHRSVGLVYGRFFTFPDGAKRMATLAPTINITGAHDLVRTYFLSDPPIIPSTTIMRRDAYQMSGGFDPNIRVFEDTDFFIRMARVTRFGFVDEPVLFKRNRKTSITGGRKDLLAHHSFVALKAAADDATLLRLVPRRLAERARKLANQQFLSGNHQEARFLSDFAVRLGPYRGTNWISWALARLPRALATYLLKTKFSRRVDALTREKVDE